MKKFVKFSALITGLCFALLTTISCANDSSSSTSAEGGGTTGTIKNAIDVSGARAICLGTSSATRSISRVAADDYQAYYKFKSDETFEETYFYDSNGEIVKLFYMGLMEVDRKYLILGFSDTGEENDIDDMYLYNTHSGDLFPILKNYFTDYNVNKTKKGLKDQIYFKADKNNNIYFMNNASSNLDENASGVRTIYKINFSDKTKVSEPIRCNPESDSIISFVVDEDGNILYTCTDIAGAENIAFQSQIGKYTRIIPAGGSESDIITLRDSTKGETVIKFVGYDPNNGLFVIDKLNNDNTDNAAICKVEDSNGDNKFDILNEGNSFTLDYDRDYVCGYTNSRTFILGNDTMYVINGNTYINTLTYPEFDWHGFAHTDDYLYFMLQDDEGLYPMQISKCDGVNPPAVVFENTEGYELGNFTFWEGNTVANLAYKNGENYIILLENETPDIIDAEVNANLQVILPLYEE